MVCRAYDLVTVAPVHVGSGEIRRANEYLYDKAHSMAYFLNETRWVAFLDKRQLMEPFLAYIEESSRQLGQRRGPFRGKNLWDWLCAQGVQPREMEALAVRRTRAERCVISEKGSLNDVHLQMALSDGRPYVPGSTIKGALRTGILYRMIQQEPERFRGFWQEILREAASRDRLSAKEKVWRKAVKSLETQALHTLQVKEKPAEMVNSALRGLCVSDAAVAKRETETLLLQKLDATTKPNRQGKTSKTLPLFRECIPPGRRLHFTLTADFSMLRTLGITSFEDIFQGLRAYTAQALALLEEEFPKYRPQFDEAREADCLLGGGTGFLSKTLVYALAPDARQAREFTAHFLDEKFGRFDRKEGKWRPTHHHVTLDRAELSPRTLKLAATAQEEWLLGLCRFEECPR